MAPDKLRKGVEVGDASTPYDHSCAPVYELNAQPHNIRAVDFVTTADVSTAPVQFVPASLLHRSDGK